MNFQVFLPSSILTFNYILLESLSSKRKEGMKEGYIYIYIYSLSTSIRGKNPGGTAKLSVLPCENIETGEGEGFCLSKNSKPRGYRASAAKGETETVAELFAPPMEN